VKHDWILEHEYRFMNHWYFKCANCGEEVVPPHNKKGWRPSSRRKIDGKSCAELTARLVMES
jgi:uncharacterized OB-fold protein